MAGLSKSCILIIVIASVERFAYKGVASNLVTYLTDVVNLSNSSAAKSLSSWIGVTSMLPLISAILADSYWDRYYTIIASSLLYVVPATFFTKQGMAMKRNIGASFEVPPAMLQSVITISIILLMPLYEKLIIPILCILTRDNKGINVLQRIGIGMLLSIVAMVVAALVESKRLEIAREGKGVASGSQLTEIQLSVLWLLPQYILLGISDVFTVVGMQEFFYTEVPTSMRTIGIALYLSCFLESAASLAQC
ncbi:hypothetical protein J5N97_026651 [Dioscorea zingiberensis]|uniref:Uncharacterized protein n=1 Tax=Dioscorea zingiberensis TaxID=325984 RepID=A0A9D5C3C1_9LILI|nr:hypothetical protein J5N97_026651 [Dioscorea zingiberensis]